MKSQTTSKRDTSNFYIVLLKDLTNLMNQTLQYSCKWKANRGTKSALKKHTQAAEMLYWKLFFRAGQFRCVGILPT